MKLHFCEAIEIENLKKIKRERNNKIGSPYQKESYFREVWNNQDLINKDLIGKVCIVMEEIGLKNIGHKRIEEEKQLNCKQFHWKGNDSIEKGWNGKI